MEDSTEPQSESLRLQLTEAIGILRMEGTLIVQAAGFFIAADALLLAYGFTQRTSSPFLLAAFMPAIMVVVYIYIRVESISIIYVAMVAEEELGFGDIAIAHIFGKTRMGYIFRRFDSDELQLSDKATLPSLLRHATRKCLFKDSGALVIWAITILQFLLFLMTILGFHYRFK